MLCCIVRVWSQGKPLLRSHPGSVYKSRSICFLCEPAFVTIPTLVVVMDFETIWVLNTGRELAPSLKTAQQSCNLVAGSNKPPKTPLAQEIAVRVAILNRKPTAQEKKIKKNPHSQERFGVYLKSMVALKKCCLWTRSKQSHFHALALMCCWKCIPLGIWRMSFEAYSKIWLNQMGAFSLALKCYFCGGWYQWP